MSAGQIRSESVAFKRRFFLPGVVATIFELLFVVWPSVVMFQPLVDDQTVFLRVIGPIVGGALLVWFVAMATWLSPVQRAIQLRRRGAAVPEGVGLAAYRATWRVPLRALLLRTSLWLTVSAATGMLLERFGEWSPRDVTRFASMVTSHAMVVNIVRAVWYTKLLRGVRESLFPDMPSERLLADGCFRGVLLIGIAVAGAAVAAASAFTYFFILPGRYPEFQIYLPPAVSVMTAVWAVLAWVWLRPVAQHLGGGAGAPDARTVYRRAQEVPYRLAASTVLLWTLAAAFIAWITRVRMEVDSDDAVLLFGITVVISVGAALYQALLHRDAMGALLDHIAIRHRLPIRGVRTPLSLRAKLLLSFGGVVVFACGLALLWGFIQYKTLVTGFVDKQADLGLAWLRSEVGRAAAAEEEAPTPTMVRRVLANIDKGRQTENAVYYYLPPGRRAEILSLGGGPMGAPPLPWYSRALISMPAELADIDVGSLGLSGKRGRLVATWRDRDYELGSIAVLFPSYTGRGPSLERPLKELLVFFLALFGACAGIAALTVREFVKPIRKLEGRADAMARGELAEPVTSGSESDEIGRLTYALEEMRRALGEKLRSTEEINVDLERAVQRRTSDLATKNRELAETLAKLTRAQGQLVRSEKMASIGQLVAGIAHEINNPVNAIVNTVGPLDEAIGDSHLLPTETEEMRDMIRVIQRGANRTKDIVRALHNYSRSDDERVVDVDLNRSLDDSLELLRHLLKRNIHVERAYGAVGRIKGHAGQLNQVFMNLLTNAAQAVGTRPDGLIRVATEASSEAVVVTVQDNGPGIPDELLGRIFDPFFTTKDVGEGTGLGLSIVHGIVERHGGTIEVHSEVEVGTSFRVSLPRGEAEQPDLGAVG